MQGSLGSLYYGDCNRRIGRLTSFSQIDNGALKATATCIGVVPSDALLHKEVQLVFGIVDGKIHKLAARVASMTTTVQQGRTDVTLSLVTRIPIPIHRPKPLTLTSAQLRAWRRGESVFRVARPKRRRRPRVPMWDRMTVHWAQPVGEPITLTPKQIREWRRA